MAYDIILTKIYLLGYSLVFIIVIPPPSTPTPPPLPSSLIPWDFPPLPSFLHLEDILLPSSIDYILQVPCFLHLSFSLIYVFFFTSFCIFIFLFMYSSLPVYVFFFTSFCFLIFYLYVFFFTCFFILIFLFLYSSLPVSVFLFSSLCILL